MGRRKSRNVSFKTKNARKKKSHRKNAAKCRKGSAVCDLDVEKVEKGLSEICSGLNDLGIVQTRKRLNATSTFLIENGIDEIQLSRSQRRKNSRKKTNRIYSMAKLISALPNEEKPNVQSFSIKSASEISQRDTKKHSKKVISKERKSARRQKHCLFS